MYDERPQKERVIEMLEAGPVCGSSLVRAYMPRGAAVVCSLRKEGWRIRTRKCVNPAHQHRIDNQVEYVLTGRPYTPPTQGSFGLVPPPNMRSARG